MIDNPPRGNAKPGVVISGVLRSRTVLQLAAFARARAAHQLLSLASMSEEPVKPAVVTPPTRAKTPKIVLALLMLNLGASGFSTFKLVTSAPAEAHPHADPAPTNKNEITGPIVSLQPFVVNLDEPGQSRYLKVTLQFEVVKGDAQALIEKNSQVIRDAILSHLSGLKLGDTLGAAAKDKLRVELIKKLEEIVGEHKVRRMFFQEFVVQ